MAKNADGPASGRMGFGFRDHAASGMPYRPERSPSRLNAESRAKQREKDELNRNVRRLKHLIPDIEQRVTNWMLDDRLTDREVADRLERLAKEQERKRAAIR